MNMSLPLRLTIHNYAYFLDGGTTTLYSTDEHGQGHSMTLVQHAFPRARESLDAIPGRLYFDGQLVAMRSDLERGLLDLLRSAEVRHIEPSKFLGEWTPLSLSPNALILGEGIREVMTRSAEENIQALAAQIVAFVISDAYLRFVDQVEQAADTTRYRVWLDWDPENRKRIIVKLGQFLGIGLDAARQFLDSDKPIAENITAIEVSELANRYQTTGLRFRIQPEYRWRLN